MQDAGSLAVFKVTARDQGHYKGPSGAFVTYCDISCFYYKLQGYLYSVYCEVQGHLLEYGIGTLFIVNSGLSCTKLTMLMRR